MSRPASVISLPDYAARESIHNSRRRASGALVEIPRILFEQGWHEHLRDQAFRKEIRVGGAVALGVAFGPLAKPTEIIPRLLHSRDDGDEAEPDRIQAGLPRQFELLLGGQREG